MNPIFLSFNNAGIQKRVDNFVSEGFVCICMCKMFIFLLVVVVGAEMSIL